jgi:hypothetical protein
MFNPAGKEIEAMEHLTLHRFTTSSLLVPSFAQQCYLSRSISSSARPSQQIDLNSSISTDSSQQIYLNSSTSEVSSQQIHLKGSTSADPILADLSPPQRGHLSSDISADSLQ